MGIILPQGLTESFGHAAITEAGGFYKPSGALWYVDSVTGSDSYTGTERKQPLATIAQAQTNASAGDTVIIMDGHSETYTAALTLNVAHVSYFGSGLASGKPTASITMNHASQNTFIIGAAGIELHNLYFPANTVANSEETISVGNYVGTWIENCYFEADETQNDSIIDISQGGTDTIIEGCTFVSTATSAADPPLSAIHMGQGHTRPMIKGNTFDGGTIGWAAGGYGFTTNSDHTGMRWFNNSCLRGSDVEVTVGSTGYVSFATMTGASRIDITAGS